MLLFLTLLVGPLLHSQLIPYREGKKWGFVSYETQEVVIAPAYKSVGEFSGDVAPFQKGRKFGYLNTKGEELKQPPRTIYHCYDGDMFLSYGKILKGTDGKQGYVLCCPPSDTLIPPEYDYLVPANYNNQLENLLFLVKKDGHWGIVDTSNTVILPFEYDTILPNRPYRSMLLLHKNGLYGAYVLETRLLIIAQYISATAFSNYIKVEICPGVYGYVDDKGRKYWK